MLKIGAMAASASPDRKGFAKADRLADASHYAAVEAWIDEAQAVA